MQPQRYNSPGFVSSTPPPNPSYSMPQGPQTANALGRYGGSGMPGPGPMQPVAPNPRNVPVPQMNRYSNIVANMANPNQPNPSPGNAPLRTSTGGLGPTSAYSGGPSADIIGLMSQSKVQQTPQNPNMMDSISVQQNFENDYVQFRNGVGMLLVPPHGTHPSVNVAKPPLQQAQNQQGSTQEFNLGGEDFPALPGYKKGPSPSQNTQMNDPNTQQEDHSHYGMNMPAYKNAAVANNINMGLGPSNTQTGQNGNNSSMNMSGMNPMPNMLPQQMLNNLNALNNLNSMMNSVNVNMMGPMPNMAMGSSHMGMNMGFSQQASMSHNMPQQMQMPPNYMSNESGRNTPGVNSPAPTQSGNTGPNTSTYEQFLQRQQQQAQQKAQQVAAQQQQAQQGGQGKPYTLEASRFGLMGLLSVIRMTDPDLNTLALGIDLTTLGLNLNSPEYESCQNGLTVNRSLFSTFASPWAETPTRREPEYYIPVCYYMQSPLQSPVMKMNLFSEETLFYIFYSMPRDALQVAAAAELYGNVITESNRPRYKRDWRYHKELKVWFTRLPGTASYDRGTFIYFDVLNWEKRKDNINLSFDQLEMNSPTLATV